ncbi:MAG: hypothetical protein QHI48_09805 [Bacteroidota bacterium]|nr:hypothetical protein [Bacteroidota bacterium]
MKSLSLFDLIVVATYFVLVLGIAVYFMRVNKGGKVFFTGGSMIPAWMSGMSLYMLNFSAWIFTGAAGFAYSTGWFALLYFSISPVSYFVGSSLTAAKWRRTRSISLVEYTNTRYNMSTRQFTGWVISLSYILSAGVQLASTCKLFAPQLGLNLLLIVVLIGTIVMVHNLLGGLWGDMAMDVVSGVILIGITSIVAVLSLRMAGGITALVEKLPPLTMDHMYNGVHYDSHWLVAILIITTVGIASGAAPKFYSVRDERDAKRVGRFAAAFALSFPFVFGIPPLVARITWPDLAAVDFFKPFVGINPQDLVFVALVMKLLPHGLIGVFIAAMLAATMTTLSGVYNMISAVLSRDVYQGLFRPDLTDRQLLRVGRVMALSMGLVVMGLAIVFVTSPFGIFNIMQAFFTLLNIPVTVPMAFGLIFRRVPKWSAIAAVTWGLLTGATARYALGWDIGPQVYLSFSTTFLVFASSRWTGRLFERNRVGLVLLSVTVSALLILLYLSTAPPGLAAWRLVLAGASAVLCGASLLPFARMFAAETDEERRIVEDFFRKVDTPVNVQEEVYGAGKKQISTLPIIGRTIMLLGLLVCAAFFQALTRTETAAVAVMVAILFGFGGFMWIMGKRMEARGETLRAW